MTLTAGTDLTNVAVDGSHVIYLADATAGARNFGKITAKAGSGGATPTVTVANAFGLSLSSKSWAIGGKRASIGGTNSSKLLTNNAGTGDAIAGWIVEMQSGHSETIAATQFVRIASTAGAGAFELRGAAGAATLPLLTFSNNGDALRTAGTSVAHIYADFELRNTNATKTASVAINLANAGGQYTVRGVKISHATNKFWKGVLPGPQTTVDGCEIGYCANIGIDGGTFDALSIFHCWIHDCGSHGIALSGTGRGPLIVGNIINANAGDGINDARTSTANPQFPLVLQYNTIHGNTGDGVEVTCTTAQTSLSSLVVQSNILSTNGGWGLNFSGASVNDAFLKFSQVQIRNNGIYNNTSGAISASIAIDTGTVTTDPTFTNAASGDFSIGTNLKAKGYPLAGTLYVGKYSSTYSYVDPGAAQRQEAGERGYVIGG